MKFKTPKIVHAGVFKESRSDIYRLNGFLKAGIETVHFDFRDVADRFDSSYLFEWSAHLIYSSGANILFVNKGDRFLPDDLYKLKSFFPDVKFFLFYGDQNYNQKENIKVESLKRIIPCFDCVLINNNENAIHKQFLKHGAKMTRYYHTATDVDVFMRTENIKPKYDIVFFGRNYRQRFPLSEFRAKVLNELSKEFKVKVYGTGWVRTLSGINYGNLVFDKDFAAAASNAKMTIGINAYNDIKFYTSNRLFNCMACSPHITHSFSGVEKMFEINKELLVFNDIDNLKKKLYRILNKPEILNDIYKAGREKIKKSHTYKVRAKQLIRIWRELIA